MSKIRSQLDYLMGGNDQHHQSAPRRAFEDMVPSQPHYPPNNQGYQPQQPYPSYPQEGHHQDNGRQIHPAQQQPQAYHPAAAQHTAPAHHPAAVHHQAAEMAPAPSQPAVSYQEMEKLQEGLNHLARKIQSLPKYLARPEQHQQGEQMIGEVRNGFALAQKEMHRISQAISTLQQSATAQPDFVDQLQAEMRSLHNSMNNLLQKPEPHFDLSGVSRSIETGYSEIVDRLDNWLTSREAPSAPTIEFPQIPDYSGQFDNLNRKVEEVTRAMVSMSVSAGTSEDRDHFERLEARLASLAKSVDDVITSRKTGAPSSEIVNQLQLISQKLDNMSAMEAAGSQLSGEGEGLLLRLDAIQNDMGVLAQSLEAAQMAPAPAANPLELTSIEEKLSQIRSGIETVAQNGTNAHDGSSQEILATLKDLVQRVEALEVRPVETPVIDDSRFASLEAQLREITGHLQTPATINADLGPITERLDNLEGQIATSRDIVIDMANQAAQRSGEAVDGANTAVLSAMMDEIRDLKEMLAENGNPAPAADSRIGDLADSVSAIASRLDTFEAKLDAAPAYPAAQMSQPAETFEQAYPGAQADMASPVMQVDAPSIDMSMDDGFGDEHQMAQDANAAVMEAPNQASPEVEDVPLAPGSGMPDLEALVRKAAHLKKGGEKESNESENITELMAAARRAAQAATAEAENIKAETGGKKKKSGKKAGAPVASSKFSTRYLLYAGAAALLAFGAYNFVPKVVSGFLGGGDQAAPVSATAPASPETEKQADAGTASQTPEMAPEEATAANETPVRQVSPDSNMAENTEAEPAGEDAVSPGMMAGAEAPEAPQGNEMAPVNNPEPTVAAAKVPMPPSEAGNEAIRNAAAAGDANALFEIGRRYTDGEGVGRNLQEAATWYELAAEAGNAPAQYRLGNFYEKGHGVKQNPEMASEWYKKAAAQGNALAMHNLAVLHAMGVLGGEPDMSEAIMWFQKAAELGVKDSQVNLGILYTKGMGVEENLEEAYKWFAIASRAGDSDAAKKRDTVAQAMRPEQLEKARGMAELWKPAEINRAANVATVRPEWKSASGSGAVNVSEKEMVRQIQSLLARAGFDAGPADGVMGAKTRDAIISFQKAVGMNADGKVSKSLIEALSNTSI